MAILPNDTPTTTAWKAGYEVGVAAERARIVAMLRTLDVDAHTAYLADAIEGGVSR